MPPRLARRQRGSRFGTAPATRASAVSKVHQRYPARQKKKRPGRLKRRARPSNSLFGRRRSFRRAAQRIFSTELTSKASGQSVFPSPAQCIVRCVRWAVVPEPEFLRLELAEARRMGGSLFVNSTPSGEGDSCAPVQSLAARRAWTLGCNNKLQWPSRTFRTS
jgi:hypothetical protein